MFRLLAFFIISIVILSGCATRPTQEAFDEQQVQQWIGKDADDLVTQNGPPTSTFTLSNGNRIFQYMHSENVVSGGVSYPMPTIPNIQYEHSENVVSGEGSYSPMPIPTYIPGGPYGGTGVQGQTAAAIPIHSATLTCNVRFTVDTSNKIIAWSKEGNGCVARPEAKK